MREATISWPVSERRDHKPTDSFNYVPFDSNHPKHTLKNIPYVLARRIKHIVLDETIRDRRWPDLRSRLSRLKYPMALINDAIRRATENPADRPITNTQERDTKTIIPFIQTFNPNNPAVFNDVLHPIASSLTTMDIFKECRFRRTYRQSRSLLSLLNKNNRVTVHGIKKCNEKLCKCCDHLVIAKDIIFNTDGTEKVFHLKHNFNCLSHNLIYKLVCNNCNQFYIGQTGDTLRHRMTVHRQQINNIEYSILRVSKHIARCAHNKEIKFLVAPFYKLSSNITRLDRERKEAMFIRLFKPPLNDLQISV